jgi:hypothetical protein
VDKVSSHNWDAVVERVLRSEPNPAAPPSLHARVQRRIQIELMRASEKARFRKNLLAHAFGGACAAAFLLVAAAWLAGSSSAPWSVPGGLGVLDSALAAVRFPLGALGAVGGIVLAAVLAGGYLLLFELERPAGRRSG